jgi:hypothetical protein
MTDIVERLRSPEVFIDTGGMTSPVARQAADEIERLRAERDRLASSCGHCGELERAFIRFHEAEAERDRLRDAVQWFIDNDETNEGDTPLPEYGGRCWNEINAYYIDGLNRARAALKETEHE